MTTPYIPVFGPPSQLRPLYNSRVQVQRLASTITPGGGMNLAWTTLSSILDPYETQPGFMSCRLDMGFLRVGKDQPAPLVAGRAPDRVGVCYYDPVVDSNGVPLVQAGDRITTVGGPIFGIFEIRLVPDVAQDYVGAHHIEVQVIEVAKQTQPGSPTPFPGGRPLCPGSRCPAWRTARQENYLMSSIRFEVNLYGPHGAGFELDRLAEGPGTATILRMEAALAAGTVASESRAHVITGYLKGSVHSQSSFDGENWSGEIDAARYPGIYELARGDSPTKNHPEGGHYFFDPGGPDFLREVRQAVWEWVSDGHGGPAPPGTLGPFSGG